MSEDTRLLPDQELMRLRKHGLQVSFLSFQMAEDDGFFYLGTTTGDILKMNPRTKLLADTGPVKDKYSLVSREHRGLIHSAVSFSPRAAQSSLRVCTQPGEEAQACDPRTQETQAGGSLGVQSQPVLYNCSRPARHGRTLSLKNNNKNRIFRKKNGWLVMFPKPYPHLQSARVHPVSPVFFKQKHSQVSLVMA